MSIENRVPQFKDRSIQYVQKASETAEDRDEIQTQLDEGELMELQQKQDNIHQDLFSFPMTNTFKLQQTGNSDLNEVTQSKGFLKSVNPNQSQELSPGNFIKFTEVFCWGMDTFGQLGMESNNSD